MGRCYIVHIVFSRTSLPLKSTVTTCRNQRTKSTPQASYLVTDITFKHHSKTDHILVCCYTFKHNASGSRVTPCCPCWPFSRNWSRCCCVYDRGKYEQHTISTRHRNHETSKAASCVDSNSRRRNIRCHREVSNHARKWGEAPHLSNPPMWDTYRHIDVFRDEGRPPISRSCNSNEFRITQKLPYVTRFEVSLDLVSSRNRNCGMGLKEIPCCWSAVT